MFSLRAMLLAVVVAAVCAAVLKKRNAWCGLILSLLFSGCSSDQSSEIAPGQFEKTDVFSRFDVVESVELTTYDENGNELVYRADESNWREVAALLEEGIRIPNDRKRECVVDLRIRADGKNHVGGLYYHSDTELIVGLGREEYYWRGISARDVREFMREHGTRVSPPK
jgi:hypothetical protein